MQREERGNEIAVRGNAYVFRESIEAIARSGRYEKKAKESIHIKNTVPRIYDAVANRACPTLKPRTIRRPPSQNVPATQHLPRRPTRAAIALQVQHRIAEQHRKASSPRKLQTEKGR